MSTKHHLPPLRDLPPGQLQRRKHHMLAEIDTRDRRPFSLPQFIGFQPGLRRAAIVAAALLVVVALPALAVSGDIGSLFRFSNQGASVDRGSADLRSASALDTTGATETVRLLASRAGIGIYASHNAKGGVCYFIGHPSGRLEGGLSGGCLNAEASRAFPSPSQPVVDMSALVYRPGAVAEEISRLVGVAADGVATVRVLGLRCEVVAEAQVRDNVYGLSKVPERPAAAIAGFTADGERVYLEKLAFWDNSACAR